MKTDWKCINQIAECKIINLTINGDNRGSLIALEENKDIPFKIKNVYYIYDTKKGVIRGKHAHKDLEQLIICVSGSCKILIDNGKQQNHLLLNEPDKGLYISGLVWREIYDFSDDCVLVVLASKPYIESDYIRDYDTFINLAGEKDYAGKN